MSEQEVKEFLDKVKGKNIRWTGWPTEKYIITDGKYCMSNRQPVIYGCVSIEGISYYSYEFIHSGFDHDSVFNGNWEFYVGEGISEANDAHKLPKCQCGKDKHGFASHATWCDLFSLEIN